VDSIGAGSALVAEAGTDGSGSGQRFARHQIMSAITDASSEQSTGIGHVNMAITEMDSVTQQNAALVEQAAAAAGSMQEQAAMLAALVARFKLGNEQAPARPRRRHATSRQIALAR
jgi:methyl-accepting chemotaxis protein